MSANVTCTSNSYVVLSMFVKLLLPSTLFL